jgi:hypothetical protein
VVMGPYEKRYDAEPRDLDVESAVAGMFIAPV